MIVLQVPVNNCISNKTCDKESNTSYYHNINARSPSSCNQRLLIELSHDIDKENIQMDDNWCASMTAL